ncbi:hypothetical protein H0H81_006338 [Sphagnurus paluster]|uniref:BTB domain-containing protein n=1 Tax=Sphagnurus paluster TaxID=117069 RepID=A0A9P7FY29_9AGAR|nr:hypothetical protein H0H81_006338 [Sphagnurus paluster]
MSKSQNGARIKAWAGANVGSGIVKNITFDGFAQSKVDNPVVIDQCYMTSAAACAQYPSNTFIQDVWFNKTGQVTQIFRARNGGAIPKQIEAQAPLFHRHPPWWARWTWGLIACDFFMTGSAIELTYNHWTTLASDPNSPKNKDESTPEEYILRPAWQRIGVCTAHMVFGAGIAAALLITQTRFVRTLAVLPASGSEGRRVGNERFRVHRYFFERESKVFREEIERSTAPGQPRQGDNDSTAIILKESPQDFEKLLGVFYNPKYSLYDWNTEDWATLLGLAVKWGFDEVKELALRELDKKDIPLLTRIGLYQRFNIDFDRLVPLYAELCSRPDTLDEEEAEALGLKTAVLVFRARERLRAVPSNEGKSPLPAGLEKDDVHRVIESLRNGSNASVVTSKTVKWKIRVMVPTQLLPSLIKSTRTPMAEQVDPSVLKNDRRLLTTPSVERQALPLEACLSLDGMVTSLQCSICRIYIVAYKLEF